MDGALVLSDQVSISIEELLIISAVETVLIDANGI